MHVLPAGFGQGVDILRCEINIVYKIYAGTCISMSSGDTSIIQAVSLKSLAAKSQSLQVKFQARQRITYHPYDS